MSLLVSFPRRARGPRALAAVAATLLAGTCLGTRDARAIDDVWQNTSVLYDSAGWSLGIPPKSAGFRAIFAPNILANTNIFLDNITGTIKPDSWIFQAGTKNWVFSNGNCNNCDVQTNVQYQANAGNTVTLVVNLVGASSVGLSGTGTLVLSGNGNNYSGVTNVSSGTLVVNTVLGGGSLINNSVLTFNGNTQVDKQISGAGQLNVNSQLVFTADNTY